MNYVPAFNFADQLSRMPAVSQRKFRKLAAELEDVQALLTNTLQREKQVEARAFHLGQSRKRASVPGGDPVRAEQLARELDETKADYTELLATRARLNVRLAELTNIVSRLQHVEIPNIYGGTVAVTVDAQPMEGESLVEAIERVRSEMSTKQGTLNWVRSLPLPRDELLALARTAVNDLAASGQPLVVTAGGKFSIQWDRMSVPGYPAAGDNYMPRLNAALFPEEVYQLLVNQIPDVKGFSANTRRARETALEREILQLEHEEESLVAQAQAKGLEVHRRRDASAFALLSCMLPVPQLSPLPDEPEPDEEAPAAEAAE